MNAYMTESINRRPDGTTKGSLLLESPMEIKTDRRTEKLTHKQQSARELTSPVTSPSSTLIVLFHLSFLFSSSPTNPFLFHHLDLTLLPLLYPFNSFSLILPPPSLRPFLSSLFSPLVRFSYPPFPSLLYPQPFSTPTPPPRFLSSLDTCVLRSSFYSKHFVTKDQNI